MHRRVRWENVLRVAGAGLLVAVVVAWPRLAPPEPELPAGDAAPLVAGDEPPVESAPPEHLPRGPASRRRDERRGGRGRPARRKDDRATKRGRREAKRDAPRTERDRPAANEGRPPTGGKGQEPNEGGPTTGGGGDSPPPAATPAPAPDPAQIEFGFESG
jgi:hypothetical protein